MPFEPDDKPKSGFLDIFGMGTAKAIPPKPAVPAAPRSFKNEAAIKLKPLADRVLVLRTSTETRSRGGIIIPETSQEKPLEGKIVAVGPLARVEIGTTVIFPKYAGVEVRVEETDYLIMTETEILGVLA
jgi:chaperonin GroES